MIPGPGRALRGDACLLAGSDALGQVDLAYLDPPYNQHRYDANYHVWETIVAWDAPDPLRGGLQARGPPGSRRTQRIQRHAGPCPTPWPG